MAETTRPHKNNRGSWEISSLLTSGQVTFLAELTPFCIEARYGDFKESLAEIIDKEKARVIYQKTREMFQWLYQKIR